MNESDLLQVAAVIIELIIAIIAVLAATRRDKVYGWFIAMTFILFVFFDVARIFALAVPDIVHSLIFLAACASMLYATWLIWKEV